MRTSWMSTGAWLALVLAVAIPGGLDAAELEGSVGGPLASADDDLDPAEVEAGHAFITGLEVSYWAGSKQDFVGPGLFWGLVLIPERLDLEVTVHSMVGGSVYSVPIDVAFKVPFRIGRWFIPYIAAAPVLFIEKEDGATTHDWAAQLAGGLALNMPGFNWRLYVEGDYNFRFWQDIVHQGGFSVGFNYRF